MKPRVRVKPSNGYLYWYHEGGAEEGKAIDWDEVRRMLAGRYRSTRIAIQDLHRLKALPTQFGYISCTVKCGLG